MSDKIQPSSDYNATRLAIAWDIVSSLSADERPRDGASIAKLVREIAMTLKGAAKKS